jgi:hypothetical protein
MSDVAFLGDPWYREQRSNNSFSIAAFGHRRYSEHGFDSGTPAIFYTNNHRKYKHVPREEMWMKVGYRPGRAAVCFAYYRNQRRIVRIHRAESVCVVACLRKLSNLRYHHHRQHNTETTI